jgi:hypothetical protein
MSGRRADQGPRQRGGQHRAQGLAPAQADGRQEIPRLAAYRLGYHAAFPSGRALRSCRIAAAASRQEHAGRNSTRSLYPVLAHSLKQLGGDSHHGERH